MLVSIAALNSFIFSTFHLAKLLSILTLLYRIRKLDDIVLVHDITRSIFYINITVQEVNLRGTIPAAWCFELWKSLRE